MKALLAVWHLSQPFVCLQEIASLKRQFTELLSDIGFVKEGLRARDMEKKWSQGGDGVLDATGEEVIDGISLLQNGGALFSFDLGAWWALDWWASCHSLAL